VTQRSVGIVGSGLLGMTAALRLAERGVRVTLFERSRDLGGLAASVDFAGRPVDRFYHVILPSDHRVLGLAAELGLGDEVRFRPTSVGCFGDGKLFSATSTTDFLKFPLLPLHHRLRLGLFAVRSNRVKDFEQLDQTPLLEWLERMSGRAVTERFWKPMLDSKFDGNFDDLPATYIWARSRRMAGTRDKHGREVMGWLDGGYQRLIDRLERRIRELGGEIHPNTVVDRIVAGDDGAAGIVVGGELRRFDYVLSTLMPPQAAALLEPHLASHAGADRFRYLGVSCLLLRLRRSLSPFYHLNIPDRSVRLTTIVETTHVVDPEHVGGHLVYVTRYVDPDNTDAVPSLDDARAEHLENARKIFPGLTDELIVDSLVQRARITEPVHLLGGARNVPDMFPVAGLALASIANVYPEMSSGQATIGVAERVASGILERLPSRVDLAA
jgi:protoporphyrinogen oxidase